MQQQTPAFSMKRIALILKEELGSLFCLRSKTIVIFHHHLVIISVTLAVK